MMVHPDYQRRGVRRMLTQKLNQIQEYLFLSPFLQIRISCVLALAVSYRMTYHQWIWVFIDSEPCYSEGGAAIYIRARPGAAALSRKMGYEVLEKFECDLAYYGSEGKEYIYCMKREPGAKSDNNAKLDWATPFLLTTSEKIRWFTMNLG